MPIYNFKNKDTDEVVEMFMSFSQKDEYLESHPEMQQVMLGAPALVSGVNFNKKMDNGWKDQLSRIADANPNSPLADRHGRRSSTEVKKSEAIKKHKLSRGSKYNMDL